MSVCLSVPSRGTWNWVDWRLLVKERIAKIAKLRAMVQPFIELTIFLVQKKCFFLMFYKSKIVLTNCILISSVEDLINVFTFFDTSVVGSF